MWWNDHTRNIFLLYLYTIRRDHDDKYNSPAL